MASSVLLTVSWRVDSAKRCSLVFSKIRACLQTQLWGLNWMGQVDMRSEVCGTRGFDG